MAKKKVVVLGGGPAGLALAAGLSVEPGYSVTVIEKGDFSKAIPGEHLQSEVLSLLERLSIPEAIVRDHSLRCNSITGLWGKREIEYEGTMCTHLMKPLHVCRPF